SRLRCGSNDERQWRWRGLPAGSTGRAWGYYRSKVLRKTIELAQGLKARTACLRLGSCRSWLFLLGIYKDAVRCPAAFTDEHQKTRITPDRSNLRDTSHKTSAALTPWKQRDVHWT